MFYSIYPLIETLKETIKNCTIQKISKNNIYPLFPAGWQRQFLVSKFVASQFKTGWLAASAFAVSTAEDCGSYLYPCGRSAGNRYLPNKAEMFG